MGAISVEVLFSGGENGVGVFEDIVADGKD